MREATDTNTQEAIEMNTVTVAIKYKNRIAPRVWLVKSDENWQTIKDAVKNTPKAKFDSVKKVWFITPDGLKQLQKRFTVERRDFYVDNQSATIWFAIEHTPITFEFVNEFGGTVWPPDWGKLKEICNQMQEAYNESDEKFREVMNSIPRKYVVK